MAMVNVVIAVIMGIFVLRDDQHFQKAYTCLAGSIFQQCAGQGGLACLFPFTVMTALQLVMDVLLKSYEMTNLSTWEPLDRRGQVLIIKAFCFQCLYFACACFACVLWLY